MKKDKSQQIESILNIYDQLFKENPKVKGSNENDKNRKIISNNQKF